MEKARNDWIILLCTFSLFVLLLALGCAGSDSDSDIGGNGIETKNPVINNLSSYQGIPGKEITLDGNFFNIQPGTVSINNVQAEIVIWGDTVVKVKVPVNGTSGQLKLITYNGKSSNTFFFRVLYPPKITGFNPAKVGADKQTVKVIGKNFGTTATHLTSKVGIKNYTVTPLTWNDTSLTFKAPKGGSSGKIFVNTRIGSDTTVASLQVYNEPVIKSLSSNTVYVGEKIFNNENLLHIYGSDFISPASTTEYVTIAGKKVPHTSWNDKEILIFLEDSNVFTSGDVVVHTLIGESNAKTLTIKKRITGWQNEKISTIDTSDELNTSVSAVFDNVNNKIHVAFGGKNGSNGFLKYASKDLSSAGSAWSEVSVDSVTAYSPSIVMGLDKNPKIIYYTENNTLNYAYFSSQSIWETTTIDSGGSQKLTYPYADSDLDASGNLHLVYSVSNLNDSTEVKYAKIDSNNSLVSSESILKFTTHANLSIVTKSDNLPFLAIASSFQDQDQNQFWNDTIYLYEKMSDGTWESSEHALGITGSTPDLDSLERFSSFGGMDIKKGTDGKLHIVFVSGSVAAPATPDFNSSVNGGLFYSSSDNTDFASWKRVTESNLYNGRWNEHFDLNISTNLPKLVFTKPIEASSEFTLYKTDYNSNNQVWTTAEQIVDNIDSPQCGFVEDNDDKTHIFYFDSSSLNHTVFNESEITK